jgi:rhamnose utilization protein RhaD (predicted bifunctional aldolase and dehydrogenase)/NAD(P)-dependent dehydrogenase (short-subunit alcohol dehydrogenase family)
MGKALNLQFLENRWDDTVTSSLSEPELLRYRSNLLGSDLRITNFGGGNTSSKIEMIDPLDGTVKPVLWVKGSGGDLGSIQLSGFATLYLDRLLRLEAVYGGAEREDEMAELYSACTFGNNPVAASIDTPLHGFLPFPHVDHLHPDWGIALAASANGRERMTEFNREFKHQLAWLPWQRPGFELAMMLKTIVQQTPGCDGVVLGGHGIFTWGETQRECYENTLLVIDQLGQFVTGLRSIGGRPSFGGTKHDSSEKRIELATDILPVLRGRLSVSQRVIGSYTDAPEVLEFVNSQNAEALAHLGTSCPDHFVRTKIRPMFVTWDPASGKEPLLDRIDIALETYRTEYAAYYRQHASPDSPSMRSANPAVVLVPGLGMFTFGKNKTESRLTAEFYVNAIHVMHGASSLCGPEAVVEVPQAGRAASSDQFAVFDNYVALPPREAFRIEYWKLEEAKLRRQPAEKELSRRIIFIAGGGSGIGREVARLAAHRGAHVVVGDRDANGAAAVAEEIAKAAGPEIVLAVRLDICDRGSIEQALQAAVKKFGGLDILVNTAAVFPSSADGVITDAQWGSTFEINVTANYLLADEAAKIFSAQGIGGSIVLTSSANAVVAKRGSEAYDVSKAAVSHLIRELAVSLAPGVRVNGISPATVVKGSTMFPRERVKASLSKYGIAFTESESDAELRGKLAAFYAERTLTRTTIDPKDCAEAILFLAGPKAPCTTGHIIPVDGGLAEAYLR